MEDQFELWALYSGHTLAKKMGHLNKLEGAVQKWAALTSPDAIFFVVRVSYSTDI